MFAEILRFVRAGLPPVVVLENVKGLYTDNGGKTFETMKQALRGQGYEVDDTILMCSDFGLPQTRKRLFVIAFRNIHLFRDPSDFVKYEQNVSLSEFFGRNYEKTYCKTIRMGGRSSPIDDWHCWSCYRYTDDEGHQQVHKLSIDDAKRLQGIESTQIPVLKTATWELIGNTILTRLIARAIANTFKLTSNKRRCKRRTA